MNSHSSVRLKSQMFESAPKSITSSPVVVGKRAETKLSPQSEDSRRIVELELKLEKQTKQIQSDTQKIKQLELDSRSSEARYLNLVACLRDIGIEAEDILQNGGQKPKKRGSFLSPSGINSTDDLRNSPSSTESSSSNGAYPDVFSLQDRHELEHLRVEYKRLTSENQNLNKVNEQLRLQLEEASDKVASTQASLDEARQRAGSLESIANDQISLTNSRSFDADRCSRVN